MPNYFQRDGELRCKRCNTAFGIDDLITVKDDNHYCQACYAFGGAPTQEGAPKFNEPSHYHNHNIDTIKFLQEGFPPEVFAGFAAGSAVKYIQRYQYKNGREDLVKAVDFAKRLLDWHDKTHSK